MNIANILIRKVDHSDPRYPDPNPARPFADVYLCSCTTESGEEFESPYLVWEDQRGLTADAAATMLKLFAKAISDMAEKAKAA